MADYQEMLKRYRRRQQDTVIDALATSLTYADEIAVDAGLLDETGMLNDWLSGAAGMLPFVVIAVTEEAKVLLGRKTGKSGMRDGAFRMLKTGAALGVGACVTAAAGVLPAIPVTMGVRALFDRYRSKVLTGMRVKMRTARLRELRALMTIETREPRALVDASAPEALPMDTGDPMREAARLEKG